MTCTCDKCIPLDQDNFEKEIKLFINEYFDRYEMDDYNANDILFSINRQLKIVEGMACTKNTLLFVQHNIANIFYDKLQRGIIQRK